MEDLNIQVLQGFKIKARRIVKEKSYYICNTDKGFKVIRKSMDSEGHILFQHEIKEHLNHVGFTKIDRYGLSGANKPYVEYDDNFYVMTDLYHQREANFSDNNDFQKAVVTISKMHRLAKGIHLNNPVYYGNQSVMETYRKSIVEMENMKKKVGLKKRLSDFDVIFLKNYDYYYNQMKTSVQLLEKTKLSQKKVDAKLQKTICHNLLKEEYILIDNQDVYITGFSQVVIDYSIFDLCSLLLRYGKKLPKPHFSVLDILELYDKCCAISKDDLEILYPLLKYPSKFIKICNQYYCKNRTWTPNAIINRVESIVQNKDRYDEFIENMLSKILI